MDEFKETQLVTEKGTKLLSDDEIGHVSGGYNPNPKGWKKCKMCDVDRVCVGQIYGWDIYECPNCGDRIYI